MAVRLENLEKVGSLLKRCPQMDRDTLNRGSMLYGRTALYLASREGNYQVAEVLLKQPNIDVNQGGEQVFYCNYMV